MDTDKVYKALVSLSVEQSLIDISRPTYEKVLNMLYKDYRCYLPDCYEHPEYLHDTLTKIFGNGSDVIVNSIKSKLEQYEKYGMIHDFLQVISCQIKG